VRYDPDSLSKIWILPAGERAYIELGYADLRLPNTTLSEFKQFRKKLKNESERRVPAADVFDLIRKNDALVSSALAKGKQERKNRERKRSRSADPGHPLNERIPPSDPPVSTDYSRKPQAYDFED
jgi:putative transposase